MYWCSLTKEVSTHNCKEARMLSAFADRTTARPKRTLLARRPLRRGRRRRRRPGRRVAADRRRLHRHGVGLGSRRARGSRRPPARRRRRASSRWCGRLKPSPAPRRYGPRCAQQPGIVSVSERRDGQPRRPLGLSVAATLAARRRRGRGRHRARGALRASAAMSLLGGSVFAGARSATASPRTSAAPRCWPSPCCCCCRCCSSAAARRSCRSRSGSPPCSARSSP